MFNAYETLVTVTVQVCCLQWSKGHLICIASVFVLFASVVSV